MISNFIKVSVVSLLFSSFFCFAPYVLAAESSERPYENALKSFYIDDLNAAIIHLKNALRNNPSHLPSRILMAEILIAKGDGIGAEVELQFAERGNADNKRILPLLLEAYLLQDKFDKVIDNAKEILGNKRLSSDVLVLKARALLSKNSTTLAHRTFKKAFQLNPSNATAILGLAQIARKRNQHQVALDLANNALKISPLNTNAMQMKASLFQVKGDIEQAAVAISEAIAINKKHFPALLTRAGIYIEQGKFKLALIDVEVILTDIPNEPRANFLKTVITQALGMDEEMRKTISHLDTVLTGLPQDIMRENPIYLYLAGLVNFNQNEMLKAQDSLRDYIDLVPDDTRALKLIAKVELTLNEVFSAKNYLIKARLVNPDDIEIWSLLGRCYLTIGDMEKAERYLMDVVEALPQSAIALVELANFNMSAGQFQIAVENLLAAKLLEETLDTNYKLVQAYQANQQLSEALSLITTLVETYSGLSYLFQHQGILLGLTGEHSKAKQAFEKSVQLAENNLSSIIHLARIDVIEGNKTAARNRLQTALVDFPDNASLLVELGNSYTNKNEIGQAKNYYEKAYSLRRSSSLALAKLLEVLVVQKEVAEAIVLIEDFLARNNRDAGMYLRAAKLYMKDKKYDLAINAHQLSVKHAKNKANMLIAFAQSQTSIGDFDGAILSYQRALGWNENLFPAYQQLIALLAKNRKVSDAIKYIELLTQKTKNTALSNALLGDVYWFNGDFAKSIDYYQKSLSLEKSKKSSFGLYRVYMSQKSYELAENTLKNWLENNGNDLVMAIALADLYIETEQVQLAVIYYNKLIVQYGELPILLNNAAQSNVVINDLVTAERYAVKAITAAPNSPAIMDTMAWIHTKNNKLDKALALYRDALAIDSENAELKYHLAVTLHELGRKAEALQYLEQAIYSEQKFSGLSDAKELLVQLNK